MIPPVIQCRDTALLQLRSSVAVVLLQPGANCFLWLICNANFVFKATLEMQVQQHVSVKVLNP